MTDLVLSSLHLQTWNRGKPFDETAEREFRSLDLGAGAAKPKSATVAGLGSKR